MGTARVAVEAGVTLGWERWVGERGAVVGIDRYGVWSGRHCSQALRLHGAARRRNRLRVLGKDAQAIDIDDR
ncbi:MAG: hypothetical protein U0075_21305 [Thermomicrobiales bacterium]